MSLSRIYKNILEKSLSNLRHDNLYRHFQYIDRPLGLYPAGKIVGTNKKIKIFCSNDYLNMGHNKEVVQTMINTLEKSGCGAGGTRNISGSNLYHLKLEKTISNLHSGGSQNIKKAIVLNSCYSANLAIFSTLKKLFPNCIVYSDEKNHASIVNGIKNNQINKVIFKHNDVKDLKLKITENVEYSPKIIVIESIYSMSGNISPLEDIVQIAKEHKAILIVDEVHSVGMYGQEGRGIVNLKNLDKHVDIISGTLGKAFGLVGGYCAANEHFIDCLRSFSPEFIFTTALPPAICAGADKSIRTVIENNQLRLKLKKKVNLLRQLLVNYQIKTSTTPENIKSHITCLPIGDFNKCRSISNNMIENGYYIQPINYPTVPKGEELFRLTVSPKHQDRDIENFVKQLKMFH